MWHPASLLLSWFSLVLVLQQLSLFPLIVLTLVCLALAAAYAPERSRSLLWRSRWLLFSLGFLFLFITPGEFLPGVWGELGLTYEGLRQCGEHLGRLLAMLASLALLHQTLGTQGLLAGFYWLLGPLPGRATTVVRLMLVLEFVEQKRQTGWREWLVPEQADAVAVDCYRLAMPHFQLRDKILIGLLLLTVFVWVFRP
ncbi:MAG: CbiQ family ECF transporter T component [Rhodocyclaceae bacterium]|nr:CbiQ family ECF transporter T component [Rhodocyclaceae bacterium]